jgi:hypothetical protein
VSEKPGPLHGDTIGQHWPTDVVAAACIGALLPLSLNPVAELKVLRGDSTRAA